MAMMGAMAGRLWTWARGRAGILAASVGELIRSRDLWSTLLEVGGFGLITVATWEAFGRPAGLAAGGAALLIVGVSIGRTE